MWIVTNDATSSNMILIHNIFKANNVANKIDVHKRISVITLFTMGMPFPSL